MTQQERINLVLDYLINQCEKKLAEKSPYLLYI